MNVNQIIQRKEDFIRLFAEVRDAVLEVYETMDATGVELKADDSPLTQADRRANALICDFLAEISPDVPIISEENKLLGYEDRRHWTQCWLVDPLDGTKEFVKKNGEFTVNIGYVEGGEVLLGWVYVPVTDELFWGGREVGAYKVAAGAEERLSSLPWSASDEGLRIVCSRSHLNADTESELRKYQNPVLVAKGSSLKFLIIAEGAADLYPRFGPTMEWDTAAAQAVLEGAGGEVHTVDGAPLRYNKENLLNPYFVANGARRV